MKMRNNYDQDILERVIVWCVGACVLCFLLLMAIH